MVNFEPALLTTADRAARLVRFNVRRLTAAGLMDEAERASGLRLSSRDLEPALNALLEACEQEAELSLFGRLAIRWDALGLLHNVLRLDAAEVENPQIVSAEVEAPIFITGLPRSGTTFLHTLLGLDPANLVPRSWQTIQPYPDARDRRRDRRVQRAEWRLAAFRRIAPGVSDLHPIAANAPQECSAMTAHVFRSLRFDTMYYVPSYLHWLERRGHVEAFRFHKRFLQHLQAQAQAQDQADGGRWILKCPDHVFTLEAIAEVYPEARFVFVHRDPVAVLPSVARLTEALRAPFTRKRNRVAIGAEVSARWELGAEKIIAASAALPQERVLHLRYEQVTAEPLTTLTRFYDYFAIPFSQVARQRVTSFVASYPRGGYAVNRYDPADYGLEAGRLRELFAPYIRTFAEAPRTSFA